MLHQTHRESIGKGKQCKFGEKITLSIFWEKAGIFSREKNTDSSIGFADRGCAGLCLLPAEFFGEKYFG